MMVEVTVFVVVVVTVCGGVCDGGDGSSVGDDMDGGYGCSDDGDDVDSDNEDDHDDDVTTTKLKKNGARVVFRLLLLCFANAVLVFVLV